MAHVMEAMIASVDMSAEDQLRLYTFDCLRQRTTAKMRRLRLQRDVYVPPFDEWQRVRDKDVHTLRDPREMIRKIILVSRLKRPSPANRSTNWRSQFVTSNSRTP